MVRRQTNLIKLVKDADRRHRSLYEHQQVRCPPQQQLDAELARLVTEWFSVAWVASAASS